MKSVRMLIVEDVDEMRELLTTMFEGVPDIRVSAKAASVTEGRRVVSRDRPDLVLLDEILPGEAALDWVPELVEQGIRVVLITGMDRPEHSVTPGASLRLAKPSWETLSVDLPRYVRELRALMQT